MKNEMKKYDDWISENVDETYGKCAELTLEMQEAFPELTRVRGHYYCYVWGEREHWWLLDEETVVDPSADQFPSKGTGLYVPLDESQPEPTGKCPNCGDYCYTGKSLCSENCEISYLAYLNNF
jgi:hypothetical protein